MPTSCCVVGCTNGHCKDAPYRFYRFPKDSSRKQRWIAAVRRVNIDGSAWQPSAGDRVCSLHFVSGERNDNPTHPGYVPTLNMKGEVITEGASTATEQSVSRVISPRLRNKGIGASARGWLVSNPDPFRHFIKWRNGSG